MHQPGLFLDGSICPELGIEMFRPLPSCLKGGGLVLWESPIAYRNFCRDPISPFETHLECESRLEIRVAWSSPFFSQVPLQITRSPSFT